MPKYFITGGAGFIGSHFCRLALTEHWCESLANVDALTYAGNLGNLGEISEHPNYQFLRAGLVSERDRITDFVEEFEPTAIIHFAAESHVDRSIEDPSVFLKTNVLGTYNLLELLRRSKSAWAKRVRFLYVSTDEVYGSLGPTGYFYESTPIQPRSPYSASKASADLLSQAYFHTYGTDVVVVRCSNNYGPNQFPEKLLPGETHSAYF